MLAPTFRARSWPVTTRTLPTARCPRIRPPPPTTPAGVYDTTRKVPTCHFLAPVCGSGTLLDSRNTTLPLNDGMPAGSGPKEPHGAVNTLFASCSDGSAGSYDTDEHIDAIYVSTAPLGGWGGGGWMRELVTPHSTGGSGRPLRTVQ